MAVSYRRWRASSPCLVGPGGRPRPRRKPVLFSVWPDSPLTFLVNMFTVFSMNGPGLQSSALGGRHLILYDGICALCNRLIKFVLPLDTSGVFQFVSLQSVLGSSVLQRYGRDPNQLDTFYILPD